MEIPLFPLRTVLFPGMELPLRIFEPRYKQMLRDVLRDRREFGVVLIKEGEEVGGGAIPHEHGTLATVQNIESLDNGQVMVSTRGTRRFRLEEMLEPRPYPYGRISLMDDERGKDRPEQLAPFLSRVRALFPVYFQLAMSITDQWARTAALPEGSHETVNFIGPWLQVTEEVKQRLIEDESEVARLEVLASVLEGLVAQVEAQAREHRLRKYGSLSAQN